MAKTRSHPVRGFIDMMSEMERIRNLGRTGYESGQPTTRRTQSTAWVPATDMVARGKDLVIATELAGVPASDIDISVSDGVLTISGQREVESDQETVTPYLRERYHGSFKRSLVLPEGVDVRTISARFDNGVVEITVPDAVDASVSMPHRIPLVEI